MGLEDVVRRALGAVCAQAPPNAYVWSNWSQFLKSPESFLERIERTWGAPPHERAFVVYRDGSVTYVPGERTYTAVPIEVLRGPAAMVHLHPLAEPVPSEPDIEVASGLFPMMSHYVCTRVDLDRAVCCRYWPLDEERLRRLMELGEWVRSQGPPRRFRIFSGGELVAVVTSRELFEEVIERLRSVAEVIEVEVPIAVSHPIEGIEAA